MARIDDVKRDIQDFSSLIAKRDNPDLQQKLSASLCVRISSLPSLSAQDAIVLTDLVEQMCTVKHVKDEVMSAIDCKVAKVAVSTGVPEGSDHTEQSLTHLYNYLSAKDWAVLEDYRASETKKINVISNRLHRLGLTQPGHDKCIKWVVVILLYCEHSHNKNWPSYHSIYNTFRDVVQYMKDTAGPFTRSNILAYPESPLTLPPSVFKAAYDDDDPPVEKFIDQYITLGKHVPLRSDNKLLTQERAGPWGTHGVPATRGGNRGQCSFEHLAMHIHDAYAAGMSTSKSAPHHVPTNSFKPPAKTVPHTPAAQDSAGEPAATPLVQPEAAAAPAVGAASAHGGAEAALAADDGGRVEQESYEEQAFNALKGKANKKKEEKAANKKPAGAPGVAKKPAGAPGVALRRPAGYSAAKVVAFKVVFGPEDRQRSMNAYASMWYGRALTWSKHNGYNEKKQLVFARDTYQEASKLWKSKKSA